MISAAKAMKAYPLLVKPFLIAGGTKTFVWLHRAGIAAIRTAGIDR